MKHEEIRRLCAAGALRWTDHSIMRAMQRGICRDDVKYAVTGGEILEQYQEDHPYPSCLMNGQTLDGRPLHVVCGIGDGELWIITVYIPDAAKWSDGYKARRESTQ